MKKQSLLITGATGFLGGHLVSIAAKYYSQVFATYHASDAQNSMHAVEWINMDVTDRDTVTKVVCEVSPCVIIHAAAIANVDTCARHRDAARAVNVAGTENIARAAEKIGCRLIFVSTDFVFRGCKSFYSEKDNPEPLSYYGKTKLAAEESATSLTSDICIVRLSPLYGPSVNKSNCFTNTIICRLIKGESVDLFVDEFRTPIYVKNLCEILIELANRRDLQGIYHLGGPQRVSRLQFGWKLCDIFGFSRRLIQPIKMRSYISEYTRPKDCSLNSAKAMKILTTRFWTIDEGLEDMKSLQQPIERLIPIEQANIAKNGLLRPSIMP